MTDHRTLGRRTRAEVAAAAAERARRVVCDIVSESGGRTITDLRSATFTRPGASTVEPEPIAGLEAARELERAAHDLVSEHIRLARETGRSWYEIGEALDLHWHAVANKIPVAEEAYDYALRAYRSLGRASFSWTCPACQQTITDHGPYPAVPEREDGHADGCGRWEAALHEWTQRDASG